MIDGFPGKLYAALQQGELTVEQIADVLWGADKPSTYQTAVRVHVHKLKSMLAREGKQTVESVRAQRVKNAGDKKEPGRYRLVG
jgi:DNA-binding SARP family transcriptional activator